MNEDSILRDEAKALYRFDPERRVYRLIEQAPTPLTDYSTEDASAWASFQKQLMSSNKSPESYMFKPDIVRSEWEFRTRYFERRGLLEGNVLDIGGGWGLLREWWRAGPSDVYVVHDPGGDSYEAGPHPIHRETHALGLARPCTFVEGFGESLPYADARFDSVVIASALDHVIDPERVLQEASRCLRPGGRLLIFQHVEDLATLVPGYHTPAKRLQRILRDPRRILGFVRSRISERLEGDAHIHHFTTASLRGLAEKRKLEAIRFDLVDANTRTAAMECRKPGIEARTATAVA